MKVVLLLSMLLASGAQAFDVRCEKSVLSNQTRLTTLTSLRDFGVVMQSGDCVTPSSGSPRVCTRGTSEMLADMKSICSQSLIVDANCAQTERVRAGQTVAFQVDCPTVRLTFDADRAGGATLECFVNGASQKVWDLGVCE